jgi:hypothetical protein
MRIRPGRALEGDGAPGRGDGLLDHRRDDRPGWRCEILHAGRRLTGVILPGKRLAMRKVAH